jgi:soluble lytic murein transglycosylase-like protein
MTPAIAGVPAWAPAVLGVGAVVAWWTRRRLAAVVLAGALLTVCGALPALLPGGGRLGGDLATDAPVPAALRPAIVSAGSRCRDITPALLAAQLWQESGFDPSASSAAGAKGIAQFIPATWATWGAGGDVWNPTDAIAAQGRFMCHLASAARSGISAGRLSGTVPALALAGYNAGFGAVQAAHGVPAILETTRYVAAITARTHVYTR